MSSRSRSAAASILLITSVSACTTSRLIPPGVSGDPAAITVSNTWGIEESWPYAVEHCAKYGKVPKVNRRKPVFSIVYDCVTKGIDR